MLDPLPTPLADRPGRHPLPGGVLTTADLRTQGWSERDLARALREGELRRVHRGHYVADAPATRRDAHLTRARGVLLGRGDHVVASHATAALVHGLPVPDESPLVHVTVDVAHTGRRRGGVHVHAARLDAEDVVVVDGMRVTSLARTVADVARGVPYAWGVAAADRALRLGLTHDDLQREAERCGVRHGVGTLRRVVAFADGRSGSVAESISRVSMDAAGLPRPVLQIEVIDPEIGWVATCDFGWEGFGVVGEMDGAAKYGALLRPGQTAQQRVMEDKRREELIRQAGWWPTRWDWATAWNPNRLGAQLRGAFAQMAERSRRRRRA